MKKIYALLMVIVLSAIVTSIVVVTKDKKKTDTSSQDASSAASAPAESVPGRESSAPDEQSLDISEPEGSSEPETTSEEESSEDESSEPEESSEEEPATTAEAIVKLAYKLIGTEYKYGGEGPDKFDNSGFTYYVCRQCGVKAPRLVGGMMNFGTEVGRNELQPGDILIFRNEIDGPPAFMGIYVGEDQFIACNNETTPTKLQKISNYWNARFVCGRRVG
jgi:cell wall-associated NlpC family hydrolase